MDDQADALRSQLHRLLQNSQHLCSRSKLVLREATQKRQAAQSTAMEEMLMMSLTQRLEEAEKKAAKMSLTQGHLHELGF